MCCSVANPLVKWAQTRNMVTLKIPLGTGQGRGEVKDEKVTFSKEGHLRLTASRYASHTCNLMCCDPRADITVEPRMDFTATARTGGGREVRVPSSLGHRALSVAYLTAIVQSRRITSSI